MVGYGPDLNLSHPDWTPGRVLDVGRKLTALSPGLVPFSFSSPFAGGRVAALSARTLIRAPLRPSVRVFLADPGPGPPAYRARIPAEVGRIEFKAFDALPDPALYPPLLALLAGLALDRHACPPARTGRTWRRTNGRPGHGFEDPVIRADAAARAWRRPTGRWPAPRSWPAGTAAGDARPAPDTGARDDRDLPPHRDDPPALTAPSAPERDARDLRPSPSSAAGRSARPPRTGWPGRASAAWCWSASSAAGDVPAAPAAASAGTVPTRRRRR